MFIRHLSAATLAVAGLGLLMSAASAGQAITLAKVSLLASPVPTAASHGIVAQNAKVGVVWCGDDIGFCLVQFHNKQGFVAVADLELIGLDAADDVGFGANNHRGNAGGAEGPHVVIKGITNIHPPAEDKVMAKP